jgi:Rrf2 family protein
MSIFSKTCEYALRAVLYLAQCAQNETRVGLKDIAAQVGSPEAFLGKILQRLVKAGLVQSAKGPNGGFYIDAESLHKPIADVVAIIDGKYLFEGCAMGLRECSAQHPCPLHEQFQPIRASICHMLKGTTISKFNNDLLAGNYTLQH